MSDVRRCEVEGCYQSGAWDGHCAPHAYMKALSERDIAERDAERLRAALAESEARRAEAEAENRKHREAYCGPEREAFNEAAIAADPGAPGHHFLDTALRFVHRATAAERSLAAAVERAEKAERERDAVIDSHTTVEMERAETVATLREREALLLDLYRHTDETWVSPRESVAASFGNAPGHGHEVPGIWDPDNGAKAGKPCEWCSVWERLRALASVLGGGR